MVQGQEWEMGRRELAAEYGQKLAPLLAYLPWLEQSGTRAVTSLYKEGSIGDHSLPFPVYDGTLLRFVKEAGASSFMDRNYRYVYTRRGIGSPQEEREAIDRAGLEDWSLLCGILSRYVLGGMTRAALWEDGVRERIFYLVLERMKAITDQWK